MSKHADETPRVRIKTTILCSENDDVAVSQDGDGVWIVQGQDRVLLEPAVIDLAVELLRSARDEHMRERAEASA